MARNQFFRQKNRVQEAKAEVSTLEEERSKVIGQLAAQLNQIDRQMIQIEARARWSCVRRLAIALFVLQFQARFLMQGLLLRLLSMLIKAS